MEDRWIFSRLNAARGNRPTAPSSSTATTKSAQVLWHFFWHEFCDWYLELKKVQRRRLGQRGARL